MRPLVLLALIFQFHLKQANAQSIRCVTTCSGSLKTRSENAEEQQSTDQSSTTGPHGPTMLPTQSCTTSELKDMKDELTEMKNKIQELKGELSDLKNIILNTSDVGKSGGDVITTLISPLPTPSSPKPELGWTLIQKRYDGLEDFYRGWDDYVKGFGSIEADYWAGLEEIHKLTKDGKKKLKIDLEDKFGNKASVIYLKFIVGNATTKYKLNIGGYRGEIGDSFWRSHDAPFSTRDADHDGYSFRNCAEHHHSGWWHAGLQCTEVNPNGHYSFDDHQKAIFWQSWKRLKAMKSVRMLIQ